MTTQQQCRLLLGLLLMGGIMHTPSLQAEELYTLETTCRSGTAQPFACTVTATNIDDTTEYRHSFGDRTVAYRVIDSPYVRIESQKTAGAPWMSVKNATINFKTQELCFNNQVFCVKNPTFLADVLVNSGDAIQGRTKAGMAFGSNGRVDVACFDNGCDRLLEAIKR